jgi:hypothetical protein
MSKVEFTVTGEITPFYKDEKIDINKIKISVLKDDDSNYPISVEMDCSLDKKNAEILSKYLKIEDILNTQKYQLSFFLKKDVMFEYINEINRVIDINSLVEVGNGILILLDSYDFAGSIK